MKTALISDARESVIASHLQGPSFPSALGGYRPLVRSTTLSFSIKEELAWNEFIPRRGNKSLFLQFARQGIYS
jgi:hypothetical protein